MTGYIIISERTTSQTGEKNEKNETVYLIHCKTLTFS